MTQLHRHTLRQGWRENRKAAIHKEHVSHVSPRPEVGIRPLLISSRLNRLACHVGRETLVRVTPAVCP